MKYLAIVMCLFSFAACGQNPTPAHPPSIPSSRIMPLTNKMPKLPEQDCAKPAGLIGKPKSELDRMRFKNPIRILGPHTPATMDFSPQRTNFMTDDKGIITQIKCG